MKKADGTIQQMLVSLEDCFNERMYKDPDSPLRKYGLEDFDIELYEATEVKIDFKKHWELPQFSDYGPVFMLRCLNIKPTQDDVFTFHIAFYCGKLTNADAVSQKRMIKEVRDRYNINAPQERDSRWHPVWIPVYEGTGYKLTDLGQKDIDALYALFVTNFEKVYPDFLDKIEQNN